MAAPHPPPPAARRRRTAALTALAAAAAAAPLARASSHPLASQGAGLTAPYVDTRPPHLVVDTADLPRVPLDASKTVTRLAFGSCQHHDDPQPYWAQIAARAPDLFVWLGDIHYADQPVFLKLRIPASAERLAWHWNAVAARPEYRAASGAFPIVGVYDDHDMGINDGDKHFNATTRGLAQQMLWDFMGQPRDAPIRAQEGVYQHYVLGTAPKRVHLILLDVRTNRDAYYDPSGAQDMLGPAQWAWLERILRETEAEITIIGSGIQVISRGDPWIAEMWYKLPQSQAKLLALLAASGVQGAFFLSGDVHFAELNAQECPGTGYALWDVTSSGLTHSWGGPIKPLAVGICTMGITRVGRFYPEKNWGEVEVDWATRTETTWARHTQRRPARRRRRAEAADSDGVAPEEAGADDEVVETEEEDVVEVAQTAEVVDLAATTVTLRVYGIDDGRAHIQRAIPLAQLYRPQKQQQRSAGGSGNAALDALSPELRAATLECASGPTSAGADARLTPVCAAFMGACSPGIELRHELWYWGGHTVFIGGLVVAAALILASPCLAWVLGPKLPGGRPAAFAAVAGGIAFVWRFIQSLN